MCSFPAATWQAAATLLHCSDTAKGHCLNRRLLLRVSAARRCACLPLAAARVRRSPLRVYVARSVSVARSHESWA